MKEDQPKPGFELLDHPLKQETRAVPSPYVRSAALTPGPSAKKTPAPEPVKLTIDGKALAVPRVPC